MGLKITVDLDLGDFIHKWSEDNLAQLIEEEIKNDVMAAVKKSPEYKAVVQKQKEEMMKRLQG